MTMTNFSFILELKNILRSWQFVFGDRRFTIWFTSSSGTTSKYRRKASNRCICGSHLSSFVENSPSSAFFGWKFETWRFVTSKCVSPSFKARKSLQTDISTKSQKGIFCSGFDTVPMRRPSSIAIFSVGPPASNKPLRKSWVPSLCGFTSAPTINEMTSCHCGDDGSLESFKASSIMRQHFSVNLSGSIHNRIRDRNTGGFSTSIARSLRFARTTITCRGSETEIGQISNEQLLRRHHWITVWGAYIDLESYQSATPNKSLVGTYPTFASRTVAASPSPTTRTRLRCGCTSLTTRTSFKPAPKHFPKMLLISSLKTQQSGEAFSRIHVEPTANNDWCLKRVTLLLPNH